ncbi:MAG: ABC transporter ATP-binding protein, partial [Rhodospirillaceae bacterium]|nr:ABC transporter ATP-binding protein [Rhodospirillaceae bacterium]
MSDSTAHAWDAKDRTALSWLFSFVRPHRGRLAVVLLLSVLATAITLAQPYLLKLIIDRGIIAGDLRVLAWLIVAMLAVGLASLGIGGINRYLHVKLSGRVLFAMREAVYGHLQRLSPAYFARVRGGDILARIDGDVAELQRFGIDAVLTLVGGVLGLVGSVALMAWLDWRLALVAA